MYYFSRFDSRVSASRFINWKIYWSFFLIIEITIIYIEVAAAEIASQVESNGQKYRVLTVKPPSTTNCFAKPKDKFLITVIGNEMGV